MVRPWGGGGSLIEKYGSMQKLAYLRVANGMFLRKPSNENHGTQACLLTGLRRAVISSKKVIHRNSKNVVVNVEAVRFQTIKFILRGSEKEKPEAFRRRIVHESRHAITVLVKRLPIKLSTGKLRITLCANRTHNNVPPYVGTTNEYSVRNR